MCLITSKTVNYALEKGADVNSGNSRVRFPLHTVADAKQGQAEIAELFLINQPLRCTKALTPH